MLFTRVVGDFVWSLALVSFNVVDAWRSHDDTAELSRLLRPDVGQVESDDDDGSASSGSEQVDDEDQSSDASAADNDDDDHQDDADDDYDVTCASLSSRNPFELLADDS